MTATNFLMNAFGRFFRPTSLLLLALLGASACQGQATDESDPGAGPGGTGGTSLPAVPVVDDPPAAGACSDPVRDPGPAITRRLTRWEYVESVRVALGLDMSAEAALLPPELRTESFYNTAKDLRPTYERVELYGKLASQAAAKLSTGNSLTTFVRKHTTCTDKTEACETAFVKSVGLRLARRPLTPTEITAFRGLFATAASCGEDFASGAKMVVEALLQSPQFLYRSERQRSEGTGPFRGLDDYEIATRLSFLAVGAGPDDALLDAAAAGKLSNADEREKQLKRLVATAAGTKAGLRFANDWLTLDDLDGVQRDTARFPEWKEGLQTEAKEEVLRMIEKIAWKDGRPLVDLLTASTTEATPGLAKLYGLTSRGDGWQTYDLKNEPQRQGVLTTAGVLMRSGSNADAQMVSRALFVFRNFMCGTVGKPPPGTNVEPPSDLENASKRAFAEYRVNSDKCSGCHAQFDPLSFVFEPYDGIGAFRTKDDKGHTTRTDGNIPNPENLDASEPYANLDEFLALLAKRDDVKQCLVRKPFQFAIGRALEGLDDCTIADLERAMAKTDGRYADLLTAVVKHPTFLFVRRENP